MCYKNHTANTQSVKKEEDSHVPNTTTTKQQTHETRAIYLWKKKTQPTFFFVVYFMMIPCTQVQHKYCKIYVECHRWGCVGGAGIIQYR